MTPENRRHAEVVREHDALILDRLHAMLHELPRRECEAVQAGMSFKAEADQLRDWIERHGGHPQDCAIWVELDDVAAYLHPVGKCDCGLAEILGRKTERMVGWSYERP